MSIFGKIITILLILSVLISGCVNKPESNTQKNINRIVENEENLSKADWYMSIYEGPQGEENSENARMSIIPHLRELGWNGGINVVKTDKSVNFSIVIALPFKLTEESTNNMNQTLSNFSFIPRIINEKIVEP